MSLMSSMIVKCGEGLTGTVVCGKVKAIDFSTSETQNTDELTLIGDSWLQSSNGVRVLMAWNSDLHPLAMSVFLFRNEVSVSFCSHKVYGIGLYSINMLIWIQRAKAPA